MTEYIRTIKVPVFDGDEEKPKAAGSGSNNISG